MLAIGEAGKTFPQIIEFIVFWIYDIHLWNLPQAQILCRDSCRGRRSFVTIIFIWEYKYPSLSVWNSSTHNQLLSTHKHRSSMDSLLRILEQKEQLLEECIDEQKLLSIASEISIWEYFGIPQAHYLTLDKAEKSKMLGEYYIKLVSQYWINLEIIWIWNWFKNFCFDGRVETTITAEKVPGFRCNTTDLWKKYGYFISNSMWFFNRKKSICLKWLFPIWIKPIWAIRTTRKFFIVICCSLWGK